MKQRFVDWAQAALARHGYKIVRTIERDRFAPEATPGELEILTRVTPFTMTSWERLWSVVTACRYVLGRPVEGDFVECGVWRGGSAMAAALRFAMAGDTSRKLWLYDTYEGMSEPTDRDVQAFDGVGARAEWSTQARADGGSDWCRASVDDVRANLASTGYPQANIRLIAGPVESTLRDAQNLPARIAILRLDTDWYESTRVELDVLYDRLATGGVLIVDDYGHWAGARQAVDEFIAERRITLLLNRIDYTGRMAIKP